MKVGLYIIAVGCVLALISGALIGIASTFHEDEKNFKEQNRTE